MPLEFEHGRTLCHFGKCASRLLDSYVKVLETSVWADSLDKTLKNVESLPLPPNVLPTLMYVHKCIGNKETIKLIL